MGKLGLNKIIKHPTVRQLLISSAPKLARHLLKRIPGMDYFADDVASKVEEKTRLVLKEDEEEEFG